MRIAIDAMGGDFAPSINVEGAILAAKKWKDTEIVLVGDQDKIQPLLTAKLSNIRVHHTTETIMADDEPVKSVKRKKDSSLVVAVKMVRDGSVDAMISAGNTGALVATGLLIIGRINGIDRPALTQMIPTMSGRDVLILDLGATMDPEPKNLLQYAIMGSIYMEKVYGISNPRIGLLNVGTESNKGNEVVKTTYSLLKKENIHFIGNVESRDVLTGICDVLICDAFSGNILLKSFEGVIQTVFSNLRNEFTRSIITKIAASVVRPGLKRFNKKMDYREYGGAPLFGVNGICIKSHGSSNANAIQNAVSQARNSINKNFVELITSETY